MTVSVFTSCVPIAERSHCMWFDKLMLARAASPGVSRRCAQLHNSSQWAARVQLCVPGRHWSEQEGRTLWHGPTQHDGPLGACDVAAHVSAVPSL